MLRPAFAATREVDMGLIRLSVLSVVLLAGVVAVRAQSEKQGYLAPGALDILAILPPAPVKGDPRYEADRRIFRETRALVGTPRWDLATGDVPTGQADLMRDFSCALGVTMTPENAPRTEALVARARIDTGRGTNVAKGYYKRSRPFLIDKGAICQPAKDVLDSYDYPSGHTTLGWTWAMLLAELAPDRATQLLARGRAYGESRIVCGVHNASAVEGGRLSATATLAALSSSPQFQADFAAARAELAALRGTGAAPDAGMCAREASLVAQPIFGPAQRR
ncbi:phosphatase PAP2 family protein [Nostoc ellipsosporum NOK]|nr:phosphatase PAP2 family protein [Nostoc ellipsosporum NOK]